MAVHLYAYPNQLSYSFAATPAPGTTFPDWPAKLAPRHRDGLGQARQSFERKFLNDALRENGGNVSRTARVLGMSRRNLQLKIQRLGIDIEAIRNPGKGYDHE